MLLGLIVLLACLVFGVRHGGIGLAVISGIGLVIFTFVFGYKPGTPPIGVMLTILAVVTCAGFLQTSGGLTVMLKYAEKFLRNNPKQVTILAPLTTWFLTVLCGTGHVVYTMFPIIYDIAIKQNIRPERPMAVASVASQMGICASPVSVAVVSIVGFMAAAGYEYTVLQILAVSIGYVHGRALRRSLVLSPRQRPRQRPALCESSKTRRTRNTSTVIRRRCRARNCRNRTTMRCTSSSSASLSSPASATFPQLLPHFPNAKGVMKAISMTDVIQMVMLFVAAMILVFCKIKAKDVGNSQVFRSGIVALVSVYGVARMADTYFANHMTILKQWLGAAVQAYPWAYAIFAFLTSKLVNSQAAAIAIVMPLALNVGMDPVLMLSFISACMVTSSCRRTRRTSPASVSTARARRASAHPQSQLHDPGTHWCLHGAALASSWRTSSCKPYSAHQAVF